MPRDYRTLLASEVVVDPKGVATICYADGDVAIQVYGNLGIDPANPVDAKDLAADIAHALDQRRGELERLAGVRGAA